ncbi:MAG: hypothetical protein ICV72_06755 [Aldersonia sp.]|nr:hypothetical protein [Aldersonia sp.]
MIIEGAIERYHFECRNCGNVWEDDYTVQYVEDLDGTVWSFYRFEGTPVSAPVAEDVICPKCHHTHVAGKLIGRSEVPLASLDRDEPRQPVTSTREQRREAAPDLPGKVRLTRVDSAADETTG